MDKKVCHNSDHHVFVSGFRESAPYIQAFRDKTFVIYFSGDAIQDPHFSRLAQDIALLHALGIRICLVHGARPQIERELEKVGVESVFISGERITGIEVLDAAMAANGRIRLKIEAALSMGLSNAMMNGSMLRVCSGNFLKARPLGIVKGNDYLNTGRIRRVDAKGITTILDNRAIALLSPMGFSQTGELFNLRSTEVAARVATSIKADKLIYISASKSLGTRQWNWQEANGFLDNSSTSTLPEECREVLETAIKCSQSGVVPRIHLIDHGRDDGLIRELFTRDGIGALIYHDTYEDIRPARIEDVPKILELIRPLAQRDILLPRSLENIELDIGNYLVIERDGMVIACCTLHHIKGGFSELACLAVHKAYQRRHYGIRLLEYCQAESKTHGSQSIFVLTTQAKHWFIERGFVERCSEDLPAERQVSIDPNRRSTVFIKKI